MYLCEFCFCNLQLFLATRVSSYCRLRKSGGRPVWSLLYPCREMTSQEVALVTLGNLGLYVLKLKTQFLLALIVLIVMPLVSFVVFVDRSNFLGTKFTVYEIQPPPVYSERSSNRKLPPSMRVSPWVSSSTQSYNMASILYELNVLRTRGPRRMQCIMNSIPVSSIQEGGQVHSPTEFTNLGNKKNKKKSVMDFCTGNMGGESVVKEPLVLKNKSPRWHEQLQCWCLNFKGRVTVASVKNFQLIAAAAEAGKNMNIPEEEQERVILQFGKIGKDIFTMDYRYPISAFQAFAICLSSFDTKPVCQ